MSYINTVKPSLLKADKNDPLRSIASNLLKSTKEGENIFSGTTILLHLRLALYELQYHHGKKLTPELSNQIKSEIGR